jgi:hypothetical protein
MIPPTPMCLECTHALPRTDGPLRCAAFPAGIPRVILLSLVDHRQTVAGDGGIRFTPRDPDRVGRITRNPLLLRPLFLR